MAKSINKMTRKEMQSLLQRLYETQCVKTQLDQTLLNTLGTFLTPTEADGKPIREPNRVNMSEKILLGLLVEWTQGYNEKCLPAAVALEKAIWGKDY